MPKIIGFCTSLLLMLVSWCPGAWSADTPRIVSLSAGGGVACALLNDRTVRCWGDNSDGRLGNGTRTQSAQPTPVVGLSNVSMVATSGLHSCAVLTDGTVRCWGDNSRGQLGMGSVSEAVLTPTKVEGLDSATSIAVAILHTCAVLRNGTVRCWGLNDFGQLGDGTRKRSPLPVAVDGIQAAVAVTAGEEHTCALMKDGTVACWGNNLYGMLGSKIGKASARPVTVSGLTSVVALAAGSNHTCALLTNGQVWCWGANSIGQVGNETRIDYLVPVQVKVPLEPVRRFAVGYAFVCALQGDRTIQCWGLNFAGRGSPKMVDEPIEIN